MNQNHQSEIEQILKDASNKINLFREQLETKKIELNAEAKLQKFMEKVSYGEGVRREGSLTGRRGLGGGWKGLYLTTEARRRVLHQEGVASRLLWWCGGVVVWWCGGICIQYEAEKAAAREEMTRFRQVSKRQEQEVKEEHTREVAALKLEVTQARASFQRTVQVGYAHSLMRRRRQCRPGQFRRAMP